MRRTTAGIVMTGLALLAPGLSAQMDEQPEQDPGDIVEVAVANGSFTTLAKALEAAGLVETLKSEGPFTVFAPTDEAFAELPEGTLEALLSDKEKLTAVLTYHVVAGAVPSSAVVGMNSAETVNGQSLSVAVENGSVKVNAANVVAADIRASNGVIHVVDRVLLPN